MSGGKGNSRARTSSTAVNTQNTTNNVDNSVTTSDMGALATAGDIAGAAIDLANESRRDGIEGVLDSGRGALEFGSRVTADALDLVAGSRELEGRALENVLEFANTGRSMERDAFTEALTFAGDRSRESAIAQADAFSGARDTFGDALSFAKDLFAENTSLIGTTVTGLNEIARAQSTSTDERVQSIAQTGLYVAGAIVVALGLAWAFSRGN